MPRFAYRATKGGHIVRGFEHAMSEQALDKMLTADGLMLIRADEVRARKGRGAGGRALIDLCYHLAVVIEAGIPLIDGLRDLAESDHPLAEVLTEVGRQVESGSTLSAAFDNYPEAFPDFMRGLVQAGEESGSLHRVLLDLVRYLEWRDELRRQISSAVTYPAIVVFGLGALMVILGVWVLPRFLEIFAELNAELPAPTRALIAIHGFFSTWGPYLAVGCGASIAAFVVAYRRETVKRRVHAIQLRLPVIGTMASMIDISRFAHNLGLLQNAGMPMLRSLEMVEKVVQNRMIRDAVTHARERVESGATLTDSFSKSEFMPKLVVRMLSVGELSGKLDESLERVAAYYDREVPLVVNRALALFNMVVLFALGTTLGTVVLSIFVPMYQMMGDLNGA